MYSLFCSLTLELCQSHTLIFVLSASDLRHLATISPVYIHQVSNILILSLSLLEIETRI